MHQLERGVERGPSGSPGQDDAFGADEALPLFILIMVRLGLGAQEGRGNRRRLPRRILLR